MRIVTETKILRFKVERAFRLSFPVTPSEAENRAAGEAARWTGKTAG